MKCKTWYQKHKRWKRDSKKFSSSTICLNLNDYQLKTSRHSYTSTYMNSMVATNQKPIIGIQKLKWKDNELKSTTKLKRDEHKHTI